MKIGPDIVTCLFRQTGRADRLPPTALGALALTILCIGALAPAVQDCLGQIRTADKPSVRVGEYAPDFELPRLTLTTDSNGKSIGVIRETDRVKLSSFRGKKPVCLIMSSYT